MRYILVCLEQVRLYIYRRSKQQKYSETGFHIKLDAASNLMQLFGVI